MVSLILPHNIPDKTSNSLARLLTTLKKNINARDLTGLQRLNHIIFT